MSDNTNHYPPLKLEEFFSGTTIARGIFEDRFGRVRNEFHGHTFGEVRNNKLLLTEEFTYRDGKTDRRDWIFHKMSENDYMATSDAVIGEASGRTDGHHFHWTYNFRLDVGKKQWIVRFDDHMFLMDERRLLNKARAYRWGFHIGTVFLCFEKQTG
ncbi:DUF3833 family protein [Emcibacter sp.]|uniref:DUF3833 family protein n=1 Tax=Emcibacter sp. TaxID=1979954 RepID=UPI002AA782C2|nr:DUF3833 family protein [Emcibacter sp.]